MAQWAGDKRAGQFYYSTNYLTDIEHNVIVDVEPTPSHRIAEVTSTQTMIEWVEENLGFLADLISSGITRRIVTIAPVRIICNPEGGSLKNYVHLLPKRTRLFIVRVSLIAEPTDQRLLARFISGASNDY